MDRLEEITAAIRRFRDERDWMQFHHPKELAAALSIEAAELLEHFLWKTPEECTARIAKNPDDIRDELADIAIYLFELADILDVDLIDAMKAKMAKNARKYPIEKAKGSHKKYTEL